MCNFLILSLSKVRVHFAYVLALKPALSMPKSKGARGGNKKKATPGGVDCAHCHTPGSPQSLKVCSRCRRVYYCNETCQRLHWKQGGHKKVRAGTFCVIHACYHPVYHPSPRSTFIPTPLPLRKVCESVLRTLGHHNEKPCVLTDAAAESDRCVICLDTGDPVPIQSGCACRGAAGFSHVACRIKAAVAATQLGDHTQWKTCATCNQDFAGVLGLELSEARWNSVKENRDTPEWSDAAQKYALCLLGSSRHEEGEKLMAEFIAWGQQSGDGETPGPKKKPMDTKFLEAVSLGRSGHHEKAMALLIRILLDHKAELMQDDSRAACVQSFLGQQMLLLGKFKESLPSLTAAYVLSIRSYGPEDVSTMKAASDLVQGLSGAGRTVDADRLYTDLVARQKRIIGPGHPLAIETLLNRAQSLSTRGDYPGAEAVSREALELDFSALDAAEIFVSAFRETLAAALTAQGKFTEARSLLHGIIAERVRMLGKDHLLVSNAKGLLTELESRAKRARRVK